MTELIQIRGARTHNLKNLDLDLPRERLIVITGLSGSGKSSLAFDTLFAEGQRRYVESLSAYARQFLSVMDKPDVDSIDGLSPAIAIEQKSTSHNPRSTVGTVTEIHDYLRLLFARTGTPHCPEHGIPLTAQTVSQIVDAVLSREAGEALMLLAPMARQRKGDQKVLLDGLRAQGFLRVRIDGELHELDSDIKLDARRKHDVDVVVDRFKVRPENAQRLAESLEAGLQLGEGSVRVVPMTGDDEGTLYSNRHACPHCDYAVALLEPRSFSFNSPHGACPDCDGLGVQPVFDPDRLVLNENAPLGGGAIRNWDREGSWYNQMIASLAKHYKFKINTPWKKLSKSVQEVVLHGSGAEEIEFTYKGQRASRTTRHPFEGLIPNLTRRYRETDSAAVREELSALMINRPCQGCHATRLNEAARHVFLSGATLPELSALAIADTRQRLSELALEGQRATIAEPILREIGLRLGFLNNVGLGYLSLDRSADTLSGGEAQRIRLASQIGAGLTGVLYVLDEPSIGLHQRDNERLLDTLCALRDLGNTVLVVEHDEDAIRRADHVIDIGPGAGIHGGEIVASGTPEDIIKSPASLTGQYLAGAQRIEPPKRKKPGKQWINIKGARGNNLKAINIQLPIGLFTAITGVSGSGKSTLINDTLFPAAANAINKAHRPVAQVDSIKGLEHFDKVIDIDQAPIGRTPRSNPATYTGLFTFVRELLAKTPEARSRGYEPGRFSFNVRGGRCEACQGDGLIRVEMHFLPDVYVPCDVCHGQRYNRETLDIRYKGKNIHEILSMSVEEARHFFDAVPTLARRLQTLLDVGLSYLTLGQNATTLSGGEAQRIKLARELSKMDTGTTLYILDEPTTGLHFEDVRALLAVLTHLRDAGNTLVVIEHNLDVIKCADWIVDLGPEGGDGGGTIVASGAPETIVAEQSETGSSTAAWLARLPLFEAHDRSN